MYEQVEKNQENKSQLVANVVSKKKRGNDSTFQFVDNRPETIVYRKMQQAVDNGWQVRQKVVIQEMTNNNAQVVLDKSLHQDKYPQNNLLVDLSYTKTTPFIRSIVQAQLDVDNFKGNTGGQQRPWGTSVTSIKRNSIVKSINDYNQLCEDDDRTQSYMNKLMNKLDAIEHKIYRWFDATKAGGNNANKSGMYSLMDDVQTEHKKLIKRTVAEEKKLWIRDTGGEDKTEIQALWDEIVKGTGNFKIKNEVFTMAGQKNIPLQFLEDMKVELYASFARLMSRPKGRKLLMLFKKGNARDKDLEFVLAPLYSMMDNSKIGPSKAQATNEQSAQGVVHVNGGIGRGTGSDSGIIFAPGLKDSRLLDSDVNNNRILSPTFIGFGHEITHSAHYQKGSYFPSASLTGIPAAYGGDMEELLTIAPHEELQNFNQNIVTGSIKNQNGNGSTPVNVPFSKIRRKNIDIPTEGDIRKEHGLSIRHGHTNTVANPLLHPNGLSDITDSSDWATPLNQTLNPPLIQQPVNTNQKKCYITTACVIAKDLPDNCEELRVLREFRDTYLLSKKNGSFLISTYYKYSPQIVCAIKKREDEEEIFTGLYNIIRQCVDAIKRDDNEFAYTTYCEMVVKLKEEFIPEVEMSVPSY